MKLGFYLESILVTDSKGISYSSDTYMLLLPKLIKEDLDVKVISRRLPYSSEYAHYPLDSKIEFTPLSPYESIMDLMKNFSKYLKENSSEIDRFLDSIDHLIVTTAGPLSIVFMERAVKRKIPCTILVRANSRKTIPTRYKGFKKVLAYLFINYIEARIDKLCKQNNLSVIALGKQLYDHYSKLSTNCISFASSKYTFNDIVNEDRIQDINFKKPVDILFVGRLVVNKGLNELLIALSKNKDFEWKLSIVGDGEYKSALEATINTLGLQDKVTLKGNISFGEDLIEAYRAHDVLILPSYFEGLPQVILEGMANGCLVLATNVGGIPGVISHLKNGVLFEPRSVEAISNAIKILPELTNIKEIKLSGLKTAREYAQENQINNFYNVLK